MSCMWCVRMHDFFSSARQPFFWMRLSTRHVYLRYTLVNAIWMKYIIHTHAMPFLISKGLNEEEIPLAFLFSNERSPPVSVPDCKISNYQESDQCPGDWKLPSRLASERARTNRLCADRYAEITCTHRQKIMAPAASAQLCVWVSIHCILKLLL